MIYLWNSLNLRSLAVCFSGKNAAIPGSSSSS
jgi:hypothetical protein